MNLSVPGVDRVESAANRPPESPLVPGGVFRGFLGGSWVKRPEPPVARGPARRQNHRQDGTQRAPEAYLANHGKDEVSGSTPDVGSTLVPQRRQQAAVVFVDAPRSLPQLGFRGHKGAVDSWLFCPRTPASVRAANRALSPGIPFHRAKIGSAKPSGGRGSNPRPRAWEARALPTELPPRSGESYALGHLSWRPCEAASFRSSSR